MCWRTLLVANAVANIGGSNIVVPTNAHEIINPVRAPVVDVIIATWRLVPSWITTYVTLIWYNFKIRSRHNLPFLKKNVAFPINSRSFRKIASFSIISLILDNVWNESLDNSTYFAASNGLSAPPDNPNVARKTYSTLFCFEILFSSYNFKNQI